MLKRFRAALIGMVFMVWTVFSPIQAYAAVGGWTTMVATGAETAVAVGKDLAQWAIGSKWQAAIAIGTIIAGYCITHSGQGWCFAPKDAPIPEASTTTIATSVPASATGGFICLNGYCPVPSAVYSTADAACQALFTVVGPKISLTYTHASVGSGGMANCYAVRTADGSDWGYTSAGPASGTLYCPTGTLSGTSCTTTAPGYTSDGIPVSRSNSGSWTADTKDPDVPAAQPSNPATTANGTDAAGNPTATSVTSTADGGMKVENWTQVNNGGNTSTVYNSYTTNAAGAVTSVNTTTYNGTIADAQAGKAPISDFPTDYSREATQQAILDEVSGKNVTATMQSTDVWDDSKKTATDGKITDAFNGSVSGYESSKTNWFSWVWTPPTGSCAPASGSVHGWSISWNYCPIVYDIRDAIGWLFGIFGAWDIYNNLFRREE